MTVRPLDRDTPIAMELRGQRREPVSGGDRFSAFTSTSAVGAGTDLAEVTELDVERAAVLPGHFEPSLAVEENIDDRGAHGVGSGSVGGT